MPVTMSAVPPELKEAFLNGLDDFLWTDSKLAASIRTGAQAIQGLPVFTLTLQNLQRQYQKPTEVARPVGWRLFFRAANEEVAGDVVRSHAGGPPRMTALSRGQDLAATFDSVRRIPYRPEVQGNEQYELLLLRIPGVNVEGCWLKSSTDSPALDFFIPIITGMRELETYQIYRMDDFLSKARDVADQSRGLRRPAD